MSRLIFKMRAMRAVMEHWNAEGKVPPRLDEYCAEVTPKWRASFETMTGHSFNEVKEWTRCVAVASGLQEIVRAGCALPQCNPFVSCATYARLASRPCCSILTLSQSGSKFAHRRFC